MSAAAAPHARRPSAAAVDRSRLRRAPGAGRPVSAPANARLADPAARDVGQLSFATWPASKWVECVLLEQDELLRGLALRLLDPCCPTCSRASGRSRHERFAPADGATPISPRNRTRRMSLMVPKPAPQRCSTTPSALSLSVRSTGALALGRSHELFGAALDTPARSPIGTQSTPPALSVRACD